jgi:hypothetical protein
MYALPFTLLHASQFTQTPIHSDYWDSYWIVRGLLESQLYDVVNSTLQNFMDELETIGFIPNGGRIYYLNRSQPPVFIHVRVSVSRAQPPDPNRPAPRSHSAAFHFAQLTMFPDARSLCQAHQRHLDLGPRHPTGGEGVGVVDDEPDVQRCESLE